MRGTFFSRCFWSARNASLGPPITIVRAWGIVPTGSFPSIAAPSGVVTASRPPMYTHRSMRGASAGQGPWGGGGSAGRSQGALRGVLPPLFRGRGGGEEGSGRGSPGANLLGCRDIEFPPRRLPRHGDRERLLSRRI